MLRAIRASLETTSSAAETSPIWSAAFQRRCCLALLFHIVLHSLAGERRANRARQKEQPECKAKAALKRALQITSPPRRPARNPGPTPPSVDAGRSRRGAPRR